MLYYASDKIKADREVVMTAVKQSGMLLLDASDDLKADREIVTAAVKRYGKALVWAAGNLKADRDIVLAAVAESGAALEYATGHLKADREIVLIAVAQCGAALEDAAECLKADREVVLAAIAEWRHAIRYASHELQADTEIQEAAGYLRDLTPPPNGIRIRTIASVRDETPSRSQPAWKTSGEADHSFLINADGTASADPLPYKRDSGTTRGTEPGPKVSPPMVTTPRDMPLDHGNLREPEPSVVPDMRSIANKLMKGVLGTRSRKGSTSSRSYNSMVVQRTLRCLLTPSRLPCTTTWTTKATALSET